MAVGALLGVVAVESRTPATMAASGRGGAPVSIVRGVAAPSAAREAGLAARVLERPLFSPGRRPTGTEEQAATAERAPRLAGTILTTGGARLAILEETGGGAVVVREGDRRDGLVIVAISAGSVAAIGAHGRVMLTVAAGRQETGEAAGQGAVTASSGFEMSKDPRSRAAGNQDE